MSETPKHVTRELNAIFGAAGAQPAPGGEQYRPASSVGERCRLCGADASRKVEEVLFDDDPQPIRHPLTAYLCLGCFAGVMHGSALPGAAASGREDERELERKPLVVACPDCESGAPCAACRAVLADLIGAHHNPRSDIMDASYPTEQIVALHGTPLWEAIWAVIKPWDIRREPGRGYAHATGDDVQRIYDAIQAVR